jgi:hypothetical protein
MRRGRGLMMCHDSMLVVVTVVAMVVTWMFNASQRYFFGGKCRFVSKKKRPVQQDFYPECPCQTEYLLRKSKHAGSFTIRDRLRLGFSVQGALRG